MNKLTGRQLAWVVITLAITFTALSFLVSSSYAADQGVACRMAEGSVVAHIIHGGERVEFNKTVHQLNVTALSFMPKNVSDTISQITKENWSGGVLVEIPNKDGTVSHVYVQRPNLRCP